MAAEPPRPTPARFAVRGPDLFRTVARYCEFGDHRTGTSVESRTLEWLGHRLRDLGVEPHRESFTFPGFTLERVALAVDGDRVPADAFYYAGSTGPTPVEGPLVRLGDGDCHGAVAVAEVGFQMNFFAPELPAAVATARARGARALIAITRGLTEDRVQLNVGDTTPQGVPTVLVAPKDAAPLRGHTGPRFAAVHVHAAFETGEGQNLWGEVPGPPETTLVAWTPISGWYRCAAERGPGVAVLLALIARCAAMPPARRTARLLFAFTSGHELGHAGWGQWLDTHARDIGDAKFLHLGATLGATVPHRTQVFPRYPEPLRSQLCACVEASPIEYSIADDEAPLHGEQRDVAARGRPVLSFSGGHQYFHTPADTPERTLSADVLAAACRVVLRAADALTAT